MSSYYYERLYRTLTEYITLLLSESQNSVPQILYHRYNVDTYHAMREEPMAYRDIFTEEYNYSYL